MSLLTELVAPPQFIHSRIAQFEELFSRFVSSVPRESTLSAGLAPLSLDLSRIRTSLTKQDLNAAATSKIVEQWDAWCERFGELEDPAFNEELEYLFIAMPQ